MLRTGGRVGARLQMRMRVGLRWWLRVRERERVLQRRRLRLRARDVRGAQLAAELGGGGRGVLSWRGGTGLQTVKGRVGRRGGVASQRVGLVVVKGHGRLRLGLGQLAARRGDRLGVLHVHWGGREALRGRWSRQVQQVQRHKADDDEAQYPAAAMMGC